MRPTLSTRLLLPASLGTLVVAVVAGCGGSGRVAPLTGSTLDVGAAAGRIVYSTGTDICTMDRDGSRLKNLTAGSSSTNLWPTWSPDGTKIAFVSNRDRRGCEIYAMNADGTQVVRVTNDYLRKDDGCAAWSPDSAKLVFAGHVYGNPVRHLYVVNVDGANRRQLTGGSANDDDPSWSPDGTRIVYSSDRGSGVFQLWTIKPDGTGRGQLTDASGSDRQPRWSADGAKIVFAREVNGNGDIYSMNADGTGVGRLTTDLHFDDQPTWSPTGLQVAFVSLRTDRQSIYVMDADGTDVQLVRASALEPSWQRRG